MDSEPTTTYEALKLSTIYQQLLNSLESEIDQPQGRFRLRTHSQQIQLVSDAVGQALQLLSARCSRCDEECLPLCSACIAAAQKTPLIAEAG
jgi:hypothetical protein